MSVLQQPSLDSDQAENKHVNRVAYFGTLLIVILIAIPISYCLRYSHPTLSGLIELALMYPVSFLMVFIIPTAWTLFLSLPLLATAFTIVGLKRNSRSLLVLALVFAFAASFTHLYWIDALSAV